MSLFNFKYPYTNFHELNLDWLLEEMQKLSSTIETLISEGLVKANQYTDKQIAKLQNETNENLEKLLNSINQNVNDISNLRNDLNKSISEVNQTIQNMNSSLLENISQLKNYVDYENEQLYNRIIEEISITLQNLKVVNYFTGELVTVQQMFDILAQKHLEAPITYAGMFAKNNTYDDLLAYNVTYTDFNNRGNVIMIQK